MVKNNFPLMKKSAVQARVAILFAISNLKIEDTSKLNSGNIRNIYPLKKYCEETLWDSTHGKSFGIRLNDIYRGKRSFTYPNLKEMDKLIPGFFECFNYGPNFSRLWASMLKSNVDASISLSQMLGLSFSDLAELTENHYKFLLNFLPEQNEIILAALIDKYKLAILTSNKKSQTETQKISFCYLDNFIYFGRVMKILDYYELSTSDIHKLILDNSWYVDKYTDQMKPKQLDVCLVKDKKTQVMPLGVYLLEYFRFIKDCNDGFFTSEEFLRKTADFEFV